MERVTQTDDRTLRTLAHIRTALEEMIVEMDAGKITVSELAKRAGIHRKTFYLHYETIDYLYDELANDIAQELYRVVDKVFELSSEFDLGVCLGVYGELLSDNEPLHRQLFCNDSYSMVYQRVQAAASEYFYHKLLEISGGAPELTEAISLFITYGLNAIWRNYFIYGRPKDPGRLKMLSASLTEMLRNSASS